jgi:MFS family permease
MNVQGSEEVQANSLKALAIVVAVFFFTTNLSGVFLPIYFRDIGLSLAEIVLILFVTFIVIGLLPIVLLKIVRNFERIISYGIFFTMLFYIALIYVKHPVLLGLAYGLGIATFWPSFNLLQFRLGESKVRARIISLLSVNIPAIAGIVGPAVGGFVIEVSGFTTLFIVAVAFYLVAFLLSLNMKLESETHSFTIPKERKFKIFFATFILLGLSESYWVAYPFFVYGVSGTVLYMGFVYALSAIVISMLTFIVSWVSDIKLARARFATVGVILNATWYIALTFVSEMYELVVLSLLSGLGSAFSLSWFANYGDSFKKEHYASILVMMEVGLMIGRFLNLAPTYIFLSVSDYASYFALLAIVCLSLIPLYVISTKISKQS